MSNNIKYMLFSPMISSLVKSTIIKKKMTGQSCVSDMGP